MNLHRTRVWLHRRLTTNSRRSYLQAQAPRQLATKLECVYNHSTSGSEVERLLSSDEPEFSHNALSSRVLLSRKVSSEVDRAQLQKCEWDRSTIKVRTPGDILEVWKAPRDPYRLKDPNKGSSRDKPHETLSN